MESAPPWCSRRSRLRLGRASIQPARSADGRLGSLASPLLARRLLGGDERRAVAANCPEFGSWRDSRALPMCRLSTRRRQRERALDPRQRGRLLADTPASVGRGRDQEGCRSGSSAGRAGWSLREPNWLRLRREHHCGALSAGRVLPGEVAATEASAPFHSGTAIQASGVNSLAGDGASVGGVTIVASLAVQVSPIGTRRLTGETVLGRVATDRHSD